MGAPPIQEVIGANSDLLAKTGVSAAANDPKADVC